MYITEETFQGINEFIDGALGTQGIDIFCDIVLYGTMTEKERAGFELLEGEEIFLVMTCPEPKFFLEKWTTVTLDQIKQKITHKSQT